MLKYLKINFVLIFTICFLIVFGSTLFGQTGDGGTESNLNFGYGARALSLGGAFTALADDPTAVFWNPAGLEYIYQQNVNFFHTSFWEGIDYDFIGYVYPTLNFGTFGIGIGRIGVDGIPQLDNSGEPIDGNSYSHAEMHMYISGAKKLPFNTTLGVSLKYLRRGFSGLIDRPEYFDTGFGVDIGLLYRPEFLGSRWFQDWSLGIKMTNFLKPSLKEGTQSDQLPFDMKLGLMKKVRFAGGNYFNVLFDIKSVEKKDTRFYLGTEYNFRELGSFRMGINNGKFAVGAGVEYKMFQFDYTYGSYSNSELLSAVHSFSVSVNFGMNRDEMFAKAEAKRVAEEKALIAQSLANERQQFISDHMHFANKYFNDKQYMDAIVEYRQILTLDSTNVYAQTMLDSSNNMLQNIFRIRQAQAIQAALDKNRAERDKKFINSHFEKGRDYIEQNKFLDALAEFNLAHDRDSTNQTVSNAIQTTERRIAEEARILIKQTKDELDLNNYADAQLSLSKAQTLAGGNPEILEEINALDAQVNIQKYSQRGILYYQLNEFKNAVKMFEEVLALDPQNETAREYYDKSKIELSTSTQMMDPQTEKRYLIGINEYINGNYDKAIAIWDSILVEQPYNKKVLSAVRTARNRLKTK